MTETPDPPTPPDSGTSKPVATEPVAAEPGAAEPDAAKAAAREAGTAGVLTTALAMAGAAALLAVGAAFLLLDPDRVTAALDAAKTAVVTTGRSGFLLAGVAAVATAIIVTFSPLGTRQLGALPADEKPMGGVTWFCLAFGAGTLSGLAIWATAEPLYHLASNPLLAKGQAETAEATAPALRLTNFHWTLHPWALFALAGVAIAWGASQARPSGNGSGIEAGGAPRSTGDRLRPSAALAPLFRKRPPRLLSLGTDFLVLGTAVAALAIVAGTGAAQIDSAVAELSGRPSHVVDAGRTDAAAREAARRTGIEAEDTAVFLRERRAALGDLLYLLLGLLAIAGIVALTGLRRVLRPLSWIPVALLAVLLAALLVAGPTRYLIDTVVNAAGDFLGSFPRLSVATQPGKAVNPWQGWWSVFYFGTWIAMAPLVGLFLARISRGRSVRQVMIGGFVLPAVSTNVVIGIFGGAALHAELFGGAGLLEPLRRDATAAMYEMLRITGTDADNGNNQSVLPAVAAALHIAAAILVTACGAAAIRAVGQTQEMTAPRGGLLRHAVRGANGVALLTVGAAAVLIWQMLGLAGWHAARTALFLLSLPMAIYLTAATVAFLRPVGQKDTETNRQPGPESRVDAANQDPA